MIVGNRGGGQEQPNKNIKILSNVSITFTPNQNPMVYAFRKLRRKIHRHEGNSRALTHRLRENICVRASKNTKPTFSCNGNLLVEVIDIPPTPTPASFTEGDAIVGWVLTHSVGKQRRGIHNRTHPPFWCLLRCMIYTFFVCPLRRHVCIRPLKRNQPSLTSIK